MINLCRLCKKRVFYADSVSFSSQCGIKTVNVMIEKTFQFGACIIITGFFLMCIRFGFAGYHLRLFFINFFRAVDNRIYLKYPEQVLSDGTAVFGYYILEYGTDEINVYYGTDSFDEAAFFASRYIPP